MSRTLTTYKRPSIAVLLATTGTIESLAAMRVEMLRALATGEIAPSEKTVREWHEAIWVRVIELMQRCPRQAAYIFNTTLTWDKPAGLEDGLRGIMAQLLSACPSDAAAQQAQGISIEGITT